MIEAGPQFGVPGYEVNLIYITGLITLVILGAGPLSIDSILAKHKNSFNQIEATDTYNMPEKNKLQKV